MTQTGKCDTCRQRKVKVSSSPAQTFVLLDARITQLYCHIIPCIDDSQCDEERPKCGACRKKERPCTYNYGKASVFVVQDPNQLTKHGKSKTAPVMYTMESSEYSSSSSGSTPLQLRVSTQRKAGSGNGTFQTLAPVSVTKVRASKKVAVYRRKALDVYLRQLQLEASLAMVRPSCVESTLISRWIDMLGSAPADSRPLSILGTWIQSIPSRVGSNTMLDLAVEFLIDSHAVYWDDSYSKRRSAGATKSKALKELQLAVSQSQTRNTYDMVLATKLHYAAEVGHSPCKSTYLFANLIDASGCRYNVPCDPCFRPRGVAQVWKHHRCRR